MNEFENSLLNFAEIIAQNEVNKAPGTLMIKATVVKNDKTLIKVDESNGEYRIKYLDSYLTAKALNKDIKYDDGDRVNVLIPNGDFDDEDKLIINAISKNNIHYDEAEENIFSKVSENLFTPLEEIKMRTYFNNIGIFDGEKYVDVDKPISIEETGEQEVVNYDVVFEKNNTDSSSETVADENIETTKNTGIRYEKQTFYSLDVFGAKDSESNFASVFPFYLKDYKAFRLSMKVKTNIIPSQQLKGNYGLILTLPIKHKGSNGMYVTTEQSYKLDINNILGNPYRLNEWSIQNIYITLNKEDELDDSYLTDDQASRPTLQIFIRDFSENVYELDANNKPIITDPYDIFIKDICFEVYKEIADNGKTGYYLHLQADGGNLFFGPKRSEDNPNGITHKTLTPHLKFDGKKIELKNSDAKIKEKYLCYWFIEDASITTNSDFYVNYGGVGWRCLNIPTPILRNADGSLQFDYITSNYTYDAQRADVLSSAKFKCVIVVMETVNKQLQCTNIVSSEIRLEEKYEPLVIKLASVNNTNVFPKNGGEINLICSIEKGYSLPYANAETTIYFVWNRYSSTGQYIDSNFYNVKASENSMMQEIVFDSDLIQNDINTITCSVYDTYASQYAEEANITRLLGSANIAINLEDISSSVIINNNNMLFKYDADGDSPTSAKFDGPEGSKIVLQPVTLSIYNNNTGLELTEEEYKHCTVKWIAYGQDYSMIIPMMGKDDITKAEEIQEGEEEIPKEEDEENKEENLLENQNSFLVNAVREKHTFTLTNLTKQEYAFNYALVNSFDYNKMNNQIEVEVIYNKQSKKLTADFLFIKEGDPGTNNSNYTAKITYNGQPYGTTFNQKIPTYDKDGKEIGEETIQVERKLQLIYIDGEYENVKEKEEGTNNPTDNDEMIEVPKLDENGNQVYDENNQPVTVLVPVVKIVSPEDLSFWYYYDFDKQELINLAHRSEDKTTIKLATNLPSLELRLFKNNHEIPLDPSKIEVEWSVLDSQTMDSTVLLKSLSEGNDKEDIIETFDEKVIGTGCQIAPIKWQQNKTEDNIEIEGKSRVISQWGENDYIPINIIKAKIMIYTDGIPVEQENRDNSLTQAFTELYAYYPIEIIRVDTKEVIASKINDTDIKYFIPNIKGGFSNVTYSSDGKNPNYHTTTPFEYVNSLNPHEEVKYNNYHWVGGGNISIEGYEYNIIDEEGKVTEEIEIREDKEKIWGIPRDSFDATIGKNYLKVALDNLGSYEDAIEKLKQKKTKIDNDISFLSSLQNTLFLKVTENKKTVVSGLIIETLKKSNLPLEDCKPYLTYRTQLYNQFKELEKRYNNLKNKYFPEEELLDFTKLKNCLITEKYDNMEIFKYGWSGHGKNTLDSVELQPLKDILNGTNTSGYNNNNYNYLQPIIDKMNPLIENEKPKSKKHTAMTNAKNKYVNYINNTINPKIQTFTDTVMDNGKKKFNIKEAYIAFISLQKQYGILRDDYMVKLTNLFNIYYSKEIKPDIEDSTENERYESIKKLLEEKGFTESVELYYKIYLILKDKMDTDTNVNQFTNPEIRTYDHINNKIISKVYKDIKTTYYNAEKKQLRKLVTDAIQKVRKPLQEESNSLQLQIQEHELLLSNKRKQEDTVIMSYIKPIIMITNRYELTDISGWDGNRLYVKEDDGAYLFAPQVGAGRKNSDGSFTGMLMGRRSQRSGGKEEVGLFGYGSGQQSMFLDADTGAAYFGANNEIQLIPNGTSTIAGWGIGEDRLISMEQGSVVGLYTNKANFSNSNSNNENIAFGASSGTSYAYITYNGHFYTNNGEIKGVKITESTITNNNIVMNDITEIKTINSFDVDKENAQIGYGFEFSKEYVRHYKITQEPGEEGKKNPVFSDGKWKMERDGKVTFDILYANDIFSIGNTKDMNKWSRTYETNNNNEQVLIEDFVINKAKISKWDIDSGYIKREFRANENIGETEDSKLIELLFQAENTEDFKESFYLTANGTIFFKGLSTINANNDIVNGYSGTITTKDNEVMVFVNGILTEIREN